MYVDLQCDKHRYLTMIKLEKAPREILPDKYKYLLDNCDLSLYLQSASKKRLFENFFNRLRDVPIQEDDYCKWLLDIYRTTINSSQSSQQESLAPFHSRHGSQVDQEEYIKGDRSVPKTF